MRPAGRVRHGSRLGRWWLLLPALSALAVACELIADIPDVVDGRDGGSGGSGGAQCPPPGEEAGTPVLFSKAMVPAGIAVHGGAVYWAETNHVNGLFLGTEQDAGSWDAVAPSEVVADDSGVYWSHTSEACIRRAPAGGGEPIDIGPCKGTRAGQLALDDTHVYWVVATESAGDCAKWPDCCTDEGTGCVARATKDGQEVTIYASNESNPIAVAVDATWVYWSSATMSGGAIKRCPKAGCPQPPEGPEVFLDDTDVTLATRIAIDGDQLYWLDKGKGRVRRTQTTPGSLVEDVSEEGVHGFSLVVDETHVYWSDSQQIFRREKDLAGNPEPIGGGQAHSVAVDCHDIYWTDQEQGADTEGVFRASR